MASITIAAFKLRHPRLTISATGTDPDETDFAEWISWADGKIMAYLGVSALPTDIGGIMENVADDLLIRKFRYEKRTAFPNPEGEGSPAMPELTAQNKMELDSLKGQDESIEAPAFNFDLDKTTGGYQD